MKKLLRQTRVNSNSGYLYLHIAEENKIMLFCGFTLRQLVLCLVYVSSLLFGRPAGSFQFYFITGQGVYGFNAAGIQRKCTGPWFFSLTRFFVCSSPLIPLRIQ